MKTIVGAKVCSTRKHLQINMENDCIKNQVNYKF